MKMPAFEFAIVPFDPSRHGLTHECDVEPDGTQLFVLRVAVDAGPNQDPRVADLLWFANDVADVTREAVARELLRCAKHNARVKRFLGGAA